MTLVWSVDKNGTPFAQGTGSDIAFTPDDNGVFEVTLTASDEDGGSASVTQTVNVSNVSPQAIITGPTQGQEGSAVSLNASATDPGGANDPISFTWSITKQGTPFTSGTGPAISFTPDDNGLYEVTLTATDDDGGSDTITHTVDVANVAPTPSITGPTTGQFRRAGFADRVGHGSGRSERPRFAGLDGHARGRLAERRNRRGDPVHAGRHRPLSRDAGGQ